MDNKELDWSPDDNTTTNHALKSAAPTSYTSPPPIYSRLSAPSSRYAVAAEHDLNRTRSGSLSSENSLTSQSTITAGSNHYSRYGMTPVIHPSESTSTSSRSLSRLSNYSAGSQASSQNSSIPRPRTGSAASSGMPTPSRSITTRHSPTKSTDEKPMLPRASSRIGTHLSPSSGPRQKLAKRASHIPAPPSSSSFGKPMPQRTTSNSSSRSAGQPPTQARSVSRIGRASHIPTVRESSTQKATRSPILSPSDPATRRSNALSRPTSPPNAQTHHQSPSRLGMRSASACGPRQSIFDTKPDHPASGSHARPGLASQQPRSRTSEASSLDSPERRNVSAHGSNRSSGLRPPGGARSVSRIGTVKKA
ncbi:uncharacterized protein BYT42DRAFT_73403 [Radiomyces spectabilis]|uniref:uncharacterized protein n=1 Tax=Radiomyces spectabilis TaxID=64574 RepID=UPI00221F6671|nr:uncharacterized protein BYT42DRAFT_73403 [Radiomyces spectabilis]KAI8371563.1 hypothetical protein BYT42DRAFT_73403 [Radiomyces spectabilis]